MVRYASEFKEEILAEIDTGATITDVASRIGIPRQTISRWRQKLQRQRLPSGRAATIMESEWGQLSALIRSNPAGSLADYCETWNRMTGVPVSRAAMSRMLIKHGCGKRPPTGCFARDTHAGMPSDDAAEKNGNDGFALG